ncbi:MAG: hypothetical protein ACKOPO_06180 [Novosphingobium sp.]
MATSPRKIILRELRRLEHDVALLEILREHAKNESGTRLSDFGKALLSAGKDCGIKQADMARILDVTPGAVSQHYNKT